MSLYPEVPVVEQHDAVPHVLGRGGAVAGAVVGEEGVAGIAVHVKRIGFAVLVEFFLQTGGVLG